MRNRQNPQRFLLLLFLLLWSISGWPQESSPSEKPVLRILFIGNSYTYFNNLPEIFAKMAEAGHQKKIVYEMEAPGGLRLKDHWERAATRNALARQKWDYVVLQDQSQLGTNYYFEGKPRIASDELFHTYAVDFAKAIHDAGAIPVLFLTWAKKTIPQDQLALNAAYMRVAKETKSIVAPAGLAWTDVENRYPEIDLFYKDGSHPSQAGSYLNACVFYATIFGRSPVGLPPKISGTPVNLDTEKVETGRTAVLVNLPFREAQKLQEAAWLASVRLRLNGGTLPSALPAVPTLAPLPVGEKLSAENLAGTWSGTIRFYPIGPVDMTLRLQPVGAAWTGHLDLRYHAKDLPDESLEVSDLKVGEDTITFTDPKSADVSNLPVHFTVVVNSAGEMIGHAETSVEKEDRSVKVLGTWKLTRVPAQSLPLLRPKQ
ncbi:MAG: hypothetical protein ACM3JB_05310 [Acidobacteriaceae bacterium]